MNDTEKMISELKIYLDSHKHKYYENSFEFRGLRKNVPQLNGDKKDLYAVSYLVSLSNLEYDSDATYFAYFNENSKKLQYIIGPQFYEKIEK
jgi:hypothetical protein